MGGKGGPGVGVGVGEEIENKSPQKGKYFGLEPIRSISSFPSSHPLIMVSQERILIGSHFFHHIF